LPDAGLVAPIARPHCLSFAEFVTDCAFAKNIGYPHYASAVSASGRNKMLACNSLKRIDASQNQEMPTKDLGRFHVTCGLPSLR
jgi:hypothetical protein